MADIHAAPQAGDRDLVAAAQPHAGGVQQDLAGAGRDGQALALLGAGDRGLPFQQFQAARTVGHVHAGARVQFDHGLPAVPVDGALLAHRRAVVRAQSFQAGPPAQRRQRGGGRCRAGPGQARAQQHPAAGPRRAARGCAARNALPACPMSTQARRAARTPPRARRCARTIPQRQRVAPRGLPGLDAPHPASAAVQRLGARFEVAAENHRSDLEYGRRARQ